MRLPKLGDIVEPPKRIDIITISIEEAERRWEEIAALAEGGETIVVTRDGLAVMELVPYQPLDDSRHQVTDPAET